MDSEWVGRAGILAEAVSFSLIAPEILGLERLRRAQEVLERFAQNAQKALASRPASVRFDRFISVLASSESDPGRRLGNALLLSLFNVVLFMGALEGLSRAPSFSLPYWPLSTGRMIDEVLAVAPYVIAASIFAGLAGALFFTEANACGVRKAVARGLAELASPTLFGSYTVLMLGYLMSRASLSGGISLLGGQDRLRALVFSMGVVLLFGGLGTQFYATF